MLLFKIIITRASPPWAPAKDPRSQETEPLAGGRPSSAAGSCESLPEAGQRISRSPWRRAWLRSRVTLLRALTVARDGDVSLPPRSSSPAVPLPAGGGCTSRRCSHLGPRSVGRKGLRALPPSHTHLCLISLPTRRRVWAAGRALGHWRSQRSPLPHSGSRYGCRGLLSC